MNISNEFEFDLLNYILSTIICLVDLRCLDISNLKKQEPTSVNSFNQIQF